MASEDHTPGPVCLIENVKGQLVANQEALRILSAIKKPVVVVAIVGLYRTGKSYLMNRLAGKSTGFSLGSTVQSHTKGIWIWCVPHPKKPDHTLVLLDTEGLGHVEKVEEALQKFLQSKGDVTERVKALTEKEKQIEGERVKAEAAQAAAKLPKEMQQQNEQLMQRKEKSYQERGKRLREVEKEKARMREEQQSITEHRKQARLLQKGFQKEAKRLEEERIRLQQKKPKHKWHRQLWF